MHVTRLRLSGFKSFVDATEFPIEAGLTGVIGPNGCGKSNLLEALRWVMGATSAKAMRGDGMEDVIFAGAAGRAARVHAEVTLTLDNGLGDGPAAFAATPVLEVTRRIDRGHGSSYRINGAEARARDVQLLFADASTGANSPALVRQGQISELIAARPQNRRRILEEAAGVAGLHGRRHEALLRLNAAQANLSRLDDLTREVEASQARLRREARSAARYKALSGEIRKVESALSMARWSEAEAAREMAALASQQAAGQALERVRESAAAHAALLRADEPLAALRDGATAAAAVRAHLAIAIDRGERDLEAARTEGARLAADIERIEGDLEAGGRIAADAAAALTRLAADLARTQSEVAKEPERIPALEARSRLAEAQRASDEGAVEALAARLAAAEAERRAAAARESGARERMARADRGLAEYRRERAAIGPPGEQAVSLARAAANSAAVAERQARETLEAAEAARGEAGRAEAAARAAMRTAGDKLGRLQVEASGLGDIAQGVGRGEAYPSALDDIIVEPGLEAALAAALGDDLDAALDPRAPSFWAGRGASEISWPPGVAPLNGWLSAPPALHARLAFIGLVDRDQGARLQSRLAAGARLVSREGDLWRWDGFTVSSEAPRPAQVRLEHRSRLASLLCQIESQETVAQAAEQAHEAAAARVAEAERVVQAARPLPSAAASEAARARDDLLAREREVALRDARAQALDQALATLETERAEAEGPLADAMAALAALPADADLTTALAAARQLGTRAREEAFAARAALDREMETRAARSRRLEALVREAGEWRARAENAQVRESRLIADLAKARAALALARQAPARLEARRQDLADQAAEAEARQAAAVRALAEGEADRAGRERALRAADAKSADARETRAAAAAHLQEAEARAAELAQTIFEASGLTPRELAAKIGADAVAVPPRAGGVEVHLAALRTDLASMGQVNLRAEADLAEVSERLARMVAERTDLDGALERLRKAIGALEAEGRERLAAAFQVIDGHFRALFTTLFEGGAAELRLVESSDPLESGLEIFACPPGKRLAVMSLMSGGEQALTAVALIFAVFLSNPAPICVLDEVDAPLDDANVERFCNLLDEMRRRASTRFLTITHNPLTMSRMDRLFGVTMRERGVSQLVSVDLTQARRMAAT